MKKLGEFVQPSDYSSDYFGVLQYFRHITSVVLFEGKLHEIAFVSLGFFVPLWEIFTHTETSPLPVGAANFDLCSALRVSEGSLACHTNCDTGHRFIMVISEDP